MCRGVNSRFGASDLNACRVVGTKANELTDLGLKPPKLELGRFTVAVSVSVPVSFALTWQTIQQEHATPVIRQMNRRDSSAIAQGMHCHVEGNIREKLRVCDS
jgi:hypothetical protein